MPGLCHLGFVTNIKSEVLTVLVCAGFWERGRGGWDRMQAPRMLLPPEVALTPGYRGGSRALEV